MRKFSILFFCGLIFTFSVHRGLAGPADKKMNENKSVGMSIRFVRLKFEITMRELADYMDRTYAGFKLAISRNVDHEMDCIREIESDKKILLIPPDVRADLRACILNALVGLCRDKGVTLQPDDFKNPFELLERINVNFPPNFIPLLLKSFSSLDFEKAGNLRNYGKSIQILREALELDTNMLGLLMGASDRETARTMIEGIERGEPTLEKEIYYNVILKLRSICLREWSKVIPENFFASPGRITKKLIEENIVAQGTTKRRHRRTDRGEIDLRLLGVPSRESIIENGKGLGRVWLAEEIKELWFSLTELSPERFVEFNTKLIESPESFLAYLASYEGFVVAEALAQKALGFKNGQALDIRFLERFPRIHRFAKAIKQEVPLAIAMVIMESLRRIIERKEVLAELEEADAMEKELFEVHVNNSILYSLALYGDASCDVLSDPETYQVGLRRAGQFIVAGRMVKWGRRAIQAGRLYCSGAKARMAVEAAAGPETGGASWVAFTGELAATFIIEIYLDSAVTSYIEWWKERGFRVRLDEAKARIYEIKNDPHSTEEDFLKALDDVAIALEDYEYYLQLELQKTILAGQWGAKDTEEYYNKEIELIQSHAPHRFYGTYVAEAMGRSGTFSGEIEERYQKTKEGWQILRTPVFEGKPSTGSTGYWGGVSTPTQRVDLPDEEFEKYIVEKIKEKSRFRDEITAQILRNADANALLIASYLLGTETDEEDPERTTIRQLREEQIEFLKTLQ